MSGKTETPVIVYVLIHTCRCIIVSFSSVPIEVGYEFTVYTATEEEGFVTLCAVIMNFPDGAPRPITINATTEDGTAGLKLHHNPHHYRNLEI